MAQGHAIYASTREQTGSFLAIHGVLRFTPTVEPGAGRRVAETQSIVFPEEPHWKGEGGEGFWDKLYLVETWGPHSAAINEP